MFRSEAAREPCLNAMAFRVNGIFSENLSKNFSFFALDFPENDRAGRNRSDLNFRFFSFKRKENR
jgi:hypothetical protein